MTNYTARLVRTLETDPEVQAKMPRQIETEERMRTLGIERYNAIQARNHEKQKETATPSVKRLLNHAIEPVVKGIEAFIGEASKGKAGRKHTALPHLEKLEPEALAVIAVRTVLDGVTKRQRLVAVARQISAQIVDEINFRRFRETDKKAHDALVKREKTVNGSSYSRQRASMRHNMTAREIALDEWSVKTQVLVGSKLIEIVQATTGLVEVKTVLRARNSETLLLATPQTLAWLREEDGRLALLRPVCLPTIIPPRPWTGPLGGGYWSKAIRPMKLVKTRSKDYLRKLETHDMPAVYDAINAMQSTAWRVNLPVLETAKALWEQGSALAGIPSADHLPLPDPLPFMNGNLPREEWSEEQVEAFKRWKRAATDVHMTNAKLKSLRLAFIKTLQVAEMMMEEDEIFFPHQMDFRGRAYAIPMYLNPQGNDLAKGLLEFASTVPIKDETDRAWLAVHGANVYGFDKVSLEDRVRWVEENEERIIATATAPLDDTFWTTADKPFQFLAFALDWKGLKDHGYGYESGLPVQMDGSCNGLQNFSAALRDEIGGQAVNLTPSDLPADIYQIVADKVTERVMEDAASEDETIAAIARGWLKHGVDRKVCKRPVMTLAYGAKKFGFREQVMTDTVRPYRFEVGQEAFPWEGTGLTAANYMGDLIWDCVDEVVVAARAAMGWLQKAAKQAASANLPVTWTAPDGLPIVQDYKTKVSSLIKITFGTTTFQVSQGIDGKSMDRSRQQNGIAPNWVHSMDAAHMRETVRRCTDLGIRSFSLIHDSYGTHAGNAQVLADVLREAFVDLYRGDILAEFRTELQNHLPEDTVLDPTPPKGTLTIEDVLRSRYFFA